MQVKHLATHHIGLILGAFLIILQNASPTPAQTGNQSDATGPIPSTSDISGGNPSVTETQGGTETVFQGGDSVQAAVNQAGATLTDQLSTGTLATSTGEVISASAQQNVLNILTSGDINQAIASINSVTDALSTAPGSPPAALVQELTSKLLGLLKAGKVNAQQLKAAIATYNRMILASNAEFLTNPPAELIAIRVSLSRLIEAIS